MRPRDFPDWRITSIELRVLELLHMLRENSCQLDDCLAVKRHVGSVLIERWALTSEIDSLIGREWRDTKTRCHSLCRIWKKTGNGFAPWEAYRIARAAKLPPPAWVLNYFDGVAAAFANVKSASKARGQDRARIGI
jgi:hypothetical protein